MPVIVRCPNCSSKLSVADALRGERVRCPKCSTIFPSEEVPPLAPPAEVEKPAPAPLLELPSRESSASAEPQVSSTAAGFGFVELSRRLDELAEPARPAPPPAGDGVQRSYVPPPSEPVPPASSLPRFSDREGDMRLCPACSRQVHRGAEYCRHCGAPMWQHRGQSSGRPPLRRDWEPERGGLVLTLGILSLVCLVCCPPAGIGLGIAAWALGGTDVAKMRRGQMDPRGLGATNGGLACGIIGTFLNLLGSLGCLGLLIANSRHF
jgi:predicted Zn finger-like uncharacterized protein